MEGVKGYKVLDENWTAHFGYYYGGVGTTHRMEGKPRICKRGFHFCRRLIDCFEHYNFNASHRVVEVLAVGEVKEDGAQSCTNELKIVKELSWDEVLNIVNTGKGNTGYGNTGSYNSGNNNTGIRNTGSFNLGALNTGNHNYGDNNYGDRNVGNYNTGDLNRGNHNVGNRNIGDTNAGNQNAGDNNAGDCNIGDYNTGYGNIGSFNTGNFNRGDYNTGDFNVGNHSAGVFCIGNNLSMQLFNQDTDWTYSRWEDSLARKTMMQMPVSRNLGSLYKYATEEEKNEYPREEVTDFCLRSTKVTNAMRQAWWDALPWYLRYAVTSLPNFNADIFYQCTGIKVKETDSKEN